MDIDSLKAAVAPLRENATAAESTARAALDEARVHSARLDLAQMVLNDDLPSGSTVVIIDWSDEPNEDGTFDMDLGEAYDADGTLLCDAGGRGAVAAGYTAGGTAWDIFLSEESNEAESYVDVNLVHAWLSDLVHA